MTDSETSFEGVDATADLNGQQVVIRLYFILVGIAAFMGVVLSVILSDELETVALYGFIEMPPNALGLGLYGAITIGTLLGIPLLAIRYYGLGEND